MLLYGMLHCKQIVTWHKAFDKGSTNGPQALTLAQKTTAYIVGTTQLVLG